MGIQIDGPGRVVLTTASGQQLLVELDPECWFEHASGLQHGSQMCGVRAGLWALRDGRFELAVDVREPAHRPYQARVSIAEVATLLGGGPGWCWARRKVGEAVLRLLEDGTVSMRRAKEVLAELRSVLLASEDRPSRAA